MTIREALEQANRKLAVKIEKAMKTDVAREVKLEEQFAISDVVYDAYKPTMYERRGDLTGMGDINNITHTVKRTGTTVTLSVRNETDPNPGGVRDSGRVTTDKNLSELIEYGHGKGGFYDFPGSDAYMKPRPFTKETIERLRLSGGAAGMLYDALLKQGVNVKYTVHDIF